MFNLKVLYKSALNKDLISQLLSVFIFLYLYLVYLTSKKSIIYSSKFDRNSYEKKNAIYAFWHNRIAMMPFLRPKNIKVNALISPSRDGKVPVYTLKFFGVNSISGSSNKNSYTSAKTIEEKLHNGESIIITPDGSRGPLYSINGNIAKIASRNSCYILTSTYNSTRAKRLKTWDRFILPLPFGKLYFVLGNPIKIPKFDSDADLSKFNLIIKNELDRITIIADSLVK